jgi:oligopeptide/dipeptide ABC transporter ATP-binding protein
MCDRVGVMYAGQLVEEGPVGDVLFRSRHPYTRALIQSIPERSRSRRLPSIPGVPPDPSRVPPVGCAFAARCSLVRDDCRTVVIPSVQVAAGHSARCLLAEPAAVDQGDCQLAQ